jgi:MerR family transcriptional regulator, thiopeptide resistance regulator
MADEVLAWKQRTASDPDFQQLQLQMDQAYDWDADDPRLVDLAHDCLAVMERIYPAEAAAEYVADWTVDPARYHLVADHGTDDSPAWIRLNQLVDALSKERGYPTW